MHPRAPSLLIGDCESVALLRRMISIMAGSLSTVLVTGESGTGKELVARSLHACGARSTGPFVAVNCGAIPRDLIESELFGHRKGAFTGALADRVGRFELAQGGTLFLDEIGDLPLELQVKLLRVLQERQVEPLGGHRSIAIDVRIVAATHKNLEDEVRAGRFREDLYYRLNVLPVRTSPLRECIDDLPTLVEHFARRFCAEGQRPIRLGSALAEVFSEYAWPGNIRELSNLIDRFSAIYPGETLMLDTIPDWLLPSGMVPIKLRLMAGQASVELPASPEALPAHNPVEEAILRAQGIAPLHPGGISLRDRMIDIERGYIEQALDQTLWNVSQTARLLNLQRTTLIEKIHKYGLKRA